MYLRHWLNRTNHNLLFAKLIKHRATPVYSKTAGELVEEGDHVSETGHLYYRPLHYNQWVETKGSSQSISIPYLP